ncbi:MAG: undecaprenyldiphospho-muramoylpentapeptide beta-N-acetylglucosaminyltransferase [Clostridiales bacterium]|nr:undecaprenyldiphospho-muramoylpentapeptide beta-N-acetylglucosaminyltransferase [Clostridiales bacterium]
MKFILTGGGTSGHINPALTIARTLEERCKAEGEPCDIIFVGRKIGLEGELVPKAGWEFQDVEALPIPMRPSFKLIKVQGAMRRGTATCFKIIDEFKPDAVISTGGFVSAPLLRAASAKKIPIVIHESNAFAGRANKLFARKAALVLTGFPNCEDEFKTSGKVVFVGNPVRKDVFELDRAAARAKLGLADDEFLIFAMGGSLGSATITKFILDSASAKPQYRFRLSCGKQNTVPIPEDLPSNIEVSEYIDNPEIYLAAADICILRSGAITCAEACAAGSCVIFVPYPYAAHDHQTYNANSIASSGGCAVIPDDKVQEGLMPLIEELAGDKDRREKMRAAAKALAVPDTTDRIADAVMGVIRGQN